MQEIKLDKKYRVEEKERSPYEDDLSIFLDDLVKEHEGGRIGKEAMAILLGIALRTSLNNEMNSILKSVNVNSGEKSEKRTLFMHLKKTTRLSHA